MRGLLAVFQYVAIPQVLIGLLFLFLLPVYEKKADGLKLAAIVSAGLYWLVYISLLLLFLLKKPMLACGLPDGARNQNLFSSAAAAGIAGLYLLWGAGVLKEWASLFRGRSSLHKLLGQAAPLENGCFRSPWKEYSFVFGFRKPCIYLAEGVGEEATRYMIAHEQAHIFYGDNKMQVLLLYTEGFFWWNPLVKRACEKALLQMEFRCDDRVLDLLEDREKVSYCNQLLNQAMAAQKPWGLVSFNRRQAGELKKRVEHILYGKPQKRKRRVPGFLCSAALACMMFTLSVNAVLTAPKPVRLVTEEQLIAHYEANPQELSIGEKEEGTLQGFSVMSAPFVNGSQYIVYAVDVGNK